MKDKYLVIHNSILPNFYEKVLTAKRLVEEENKSVSSVCKELDISRSTFYKYKDKISTFTNQDTYVNLVINRSNHSYALIDTINLIIMYGGLVVSLSCMNISKDVININICIDIKKLYISLDELMVKLKATNGVYNIVKM